MLSREAVVFLQPLKNQPMEELFTLLVCLPLSLSYSNMPVGSDKALVGTAKNVSPFDLHNVTILASVHKTSGTQIDSVKSQVFPVIRIGQSVAFTDVPDPAIKQNIAYFSCADI